MESTKQMQTPDYRNVSKQQQERAYYEIVQQRFQCTDDDYNIQLDRATWKGQKIPLNLRCHLCTSLLEEAKECSKCNSPFCGRCYDKMKVKRIYPGHKCKQPFVFEELNNVI